MGSRLHSGLGNPELLGLIFIDTSYYSDFVACPLCELVCMLRAFLACLSLYCVCTAESVIWRTSGPWLLLLVPSRKGAEVRPNCFTRSEMETGCGFIETAAHFLGIVGAWEFLLISTFFVFWGGHIPDGVKGVTPGSALRNDFRQVRGTMWDSRGRIRVSCMQEKHSLLYRVWLGFSKHIGEQLLRLS